jgi:hypothetical protein
MPLEASRIAPAASRPNGDQEPPGSLRSALNPNNAAARGVPTDGGDRGTSWADENPPRRLPLPLAGDELQDPPLYTGDIEADIRTMKRRRAEENGRQAVLPVEDGRGRLEHSRHPLSGRRGPRPSRGLDMQRLLRPHPPERARAVRV